MHFNKTQDPEGLPPGLRLFLTFTGAHLLKKNAPSIGTPKPVILYRRLQACEAGPGPGKASNGGSERVLLAEPQRRDTGILLEAA